ncbi:hypothetical protein RNU58_004975 [Escherichia coli]|uniref:hypothetical protein n=1 Tax=Escherichia coli TaxID=562 RepID=UPI000AA5A7C2|nr:hypothetical protein [Escherichia coli]EFJ6401138.1 hypothetical protein [Escherichia coli]EFU2199025.1 hypothetical protein [Escherichia coli]EFU2630310.1 hypothetical protein [Escherichia coli]EGM6002801.1 hypothetical protein [Escherichia coli]
MAVKADTFLAVNRRHLAEAVVFIAGLVARAVSERQQLPVAAPRHLPGAARRIRCRRR